jgi:hypothetical protein
MAKQVPQLRGGGKRQWGIALAASLVASMSFAVWFKYSVLEPKKRMYKEFYDKWDDDAEFERMQKAGIFKGFEPS